MKVNSALPTPAMCSCDWMHPSLPPSLASCRLAIGFSFREYEVYDGHARRQGHPVKNLGNLFLSLLMVLRMVWLKIWNLMLPAMAIWFPLVIFVQVPCIVWVRCGEEASWWPWKGTRLNAYKVAQVTDKSNSCVHINVRSRSFYLIFVDRKSVV